MSAQDDIKRLTAPYIRARKGGEPIVFRHRGFEPVHHHAERVPDQNEIAVAVEQTRGMRVIGRQASAD
jgi:3-methyl-2-oxobutanoate hydroxymethyltransferase